MTTAFDQGYQDGVHGHLYDSMFGDKNAQKEYDRGFYAGKAHRDEWLRQKSKDALK